MDSRKINPYLLTMQSRWILMDLDGSPQILMGLRASQDKLDIKTPKNPIFPLSLCKCEHRLCYMVEALIIKTIPTHQTHCSCQHCNTGVIRVVQMNAWSIAQLQDWSLVAEDMLNFNAWDSLIRALIGDGKSDKQTL